MKEPQHKLEMYDRVMTVMDAHLPVWRSFPELSATYDAFVRNYKKLKDRIAESLEEPGELQHLQEEKRKQLSELLSPVVEVMSVYLSDTGEKESRRSLRKKAGKIDQLDAGGMGKLAGYVVDLGKKDLKKKSKPDLYMYGLREEILDRIGLLAEEISGVRKQLARIRDRKKKAVKGIRKRISRNDDLLESRMDVLLELFEAGSPDFYRDYTTARGN
jgi:regulator of replication initiation timing/uncharacterized small protein (DUF1192 family)